MAHRVPRAVRVPEPKFGWSERIAKDLEERAEKIKPLIVQGSHISLFEIPQYEVPIVDDPPELTDRHKTMSLYDTGDMQEDMQILIRNNRQHSPWVAWAIEEMASMKIKSCTPMNMDRGNGVEFGLVPLR